MEPLLITAACGQARAPGGEVRPDTPEEVSQSVYEAYQAGACIAQLRAPTRLDPTTGRPTTSLKDWSEMVERIRDKCDILIHFGVAAMQIEQRMELLEQFRPDIASFLLGHHDIMIRGRSLYSLRTRDDSIRMAQCHLKLGVKPEFEVFHGGSLWNLNYILEQVPVLRPLYMTLFFGWTGGDWSAPTADEFLHRLHMVPENSVYTLTISGEEQLAVQALSITRGGHVRVGLGDYPYYRPGVMGTSTAQFVTRMARIAEEVGREVATPEQARQILGLGVQAENKI